ncbi:MAG: HlyD family efflux transporter periplasmic adaptor subunit [Magnetococcales bacterium]|nr:HlyD family efflux transporter periplasmic adaptor subunit [Magnetococcales bacterium]MBF0150063.1 HlyD family efflux transporter periplasmic adaptor subunit [Magnetococcales bacterium]
MADKRQAIQVEQVYLAPVRHPIKAARMLYSAPPWVLSGPIYLIAMIIIAGLGYSFWATKDELVVVPLVLERESVTTEAVKGGIVSKVYVQEGSRVGPSEKLLEIQMTSVMRSPEEEAIQARLDDMQKADADALAAYELQKNRMENNVRQLELSLDTIQKDRDRQELELEDARRNVRSLKGKLGIAQQELAETSKLFQSKDITKIEHDRARMTVDDLEKSVQDAVSRESKAQLALQMSSREKINNEIKLARDELKQLKKRYDEQHQRLEEQRQELIGRQKDARTLFGSGVAESGTMTSYKSTFSGLVTAVHVKPGNNIAPGVSLVTIVKDSAALVGRALVQNKDIGRMKRGQTVRVKYFAYPYQDYGIPEGIISDIATKPGGVTGQESLYKVRIALKDESIARRGDKPRLLEIGLEGIAEIKTGEKRLIELVFSPISRFFGKEEE